MKMCSLTILILLIGCASYKPVTIPYLQPEFAPYSETVDGVTISVKIFNYADCKQYLDRDLISEGYQPIHLTIVNDTNKYILFSPQGISLPTIPAQDIAEKVHTSTVGRATAYGVGALLLWPLAIPAIVDGYGSASANEQLDRDFNSKSANQSIVQPYATLNGLIFVPTSEYRGAFNITLIDKETRSKHLFQVRGLPPAPAPLPAQPSRLPSKE